MISIDANILLYSFSAASPFHAAAKRFLEELAEREDVALSEFILAEFYLLLRNPIVLENPLDAPAAAAVIASYRRHPRWKTCGFPPRSREIHDELWTHAATANFARRRIFDTRTALSLIAFGVTDFATLNLKDFQSFGFAKVWNPLATGEVVLLEAVEATAHAPPAFVGTGSRSRNGAHGDAEPQRLLADEPE